MGNSVLIVGFGRMGLSHAVQLKAVLPASSQFHVVDPSRLSRIIARAAIRGAKAYPSLDKCRQANAQWGFDLAVICSPPFDRLSDVSTVGDMANYILIEKPVIAALPTNAMSGYVMQHCPILEHVAKHLDSLPNRIVVECQSNLDFTTKSGGWRSSIRSPLANEFFGHSATFALAPMVLAGHTLSAFQLRNIRESAQNFLEVECEVNGIEVLVRLAGGQPVRKTLYRTTYVHAHHSITFDPYTSTTSDIETSIVSVTDLQFSVGFFLRGFEFARQADRFVSKKGDILSHCLITEIEQVITRI